RDIQIARSYWPLRIALTKYLRRRLRWSGGSHGCLIENETAAFSRVGEPAIYVEPPVSGKQAYTPIGAGSVVRRALVKRKQPGVGGCRETRNTGGSWGKALIFFEVLPSACPVDPDAKDVEFIADAVFVPAAAHVQKLKRSGPSLLCGKSRS